MPKNAKVYALPCGCTFTRGGAIDTTKCQPHQSETTKVTLSDEDRDLLADALEHLYQTCPSRRQELAALALRTGLGGTVDA